jgi:hypothetical protein
MKDNASRFYRFLVRKVEKIFSTITPLIGENRQLVTNEPVEFEK